MTEKVLMKCSCLSKEARKRLMEGIEQRRKLGKATELEDQMEFVIEQMDDCTEYED